MAISETRLGHDPAFDRFLGAAVGEDHTGTSVTVLSMLARLGMDPWAEASELARMPLAPARSRLETLLVSFEDVPSDVTGRSGLASGLLGFLPRRPVAAARPTPAGPVALPMLPPLGAPIYWIVGILLVVGWIATLAQGN